MARASHPPTGKDTPEALLTEAGAARRLYALEVRAERDGYARHWSLTVYHDSPDFTYVLRDVQGKRCLSRDEALALLAEREKGAA